MDYESVRSHEGLVIDVHLERAEKRYRSKIAAAQCVCIRRWSILNMKRWYISRCTVSNVE